MKDLLELLSNNSYPGRGIVVGHDTLFYFIMGRSTNSRNRIFSLTDDGIRTEAFDARKMEDPSLIIYHPVRRTEAGLIVTNGDQTDTIRDKGFIEGCMSRMYEPDAPNFTPRISAMIYNNCSFDISILKQRDGHCLREFFRYESCEQGKGYFISTYSGDGIPLPSFEGEPVEIALPEADKLWDTLNYENKVSLYANIKGKVRLYNKNLGD